MAKQSKYPPQMPAPKPVKAAAGGFQDRDLTKVNPLNEQFEPTDAMPVRQHFKMAGGA